MPRVEVIRSYLEMTDRQALRTVESREPLARVERVPGCPPSFFRYLYEQVGRSCHWVDRGPATRPSAERQE